MNLNTQVLLVEHKIQEYFFVQYLMKLLKTMSHILVTYWLTD